MIVSPAWILNSNFDPGGLLMIELKIYKRFLSNKTFEQAFHDKKKSTFSFFYDTENAIQFYRSFRIASFEAVQNWKLQD